MECHEDHQRLEHLSYEEWLEELGLCRLEKRRVQEDFITAFQCLKGTYKQEGERLFYVGR